jgi:flagellar assembly protein FliH
MAETFQSFATTPAKPVEKFQFADLDLEREIEEQQAACRFDQKDLDHARAEAEAKGQAAGHEQAMASIEAATVRILPDILAAAQELADEQVRQKQVLEAEAIRLARLIVTKVLPVFAASKAYAEIEALITTCLNDRPEEARIVIRLPDTLLDKIQPRLESLVEKTGFAGKPLLIADPGLTVTQARVEWANGGADWDYTAQLGDIEAAAKRLVSAKPAILEAEDTRDVFAATLEEGDSADPLFDSKETNE